ncbi:hypothetical protein V1264_011869 [Littorina saxatilis]|uniref:Uncharacterized protein n=1 Tax=Littorina saxatilis TaxID=31220 RepID=A0AAN9BWJ8_9CAEN
MNTRGSEVARFERENNLALADREDTEENGEINTCATNPKVTALERTKELLEEGKLLELTGTELREFVLQQKNKERQRECEQEERQREQEERRLEREERARLEEIRIQVELARATTEHAGENSNRNNNRNDELRSRDNYQAKLPFLEDKDDIESFILQFERHAMRKQHGL